jgi:hypothetical protein
MVVLNTWQVVLRVPPDLDDDVAERIATEVRLRLEAWVVQEGGRLMALHDGCAVALDEG